MILYSLYVKFTLYVVNRKYMRSRPAIFVYILYVLVPQHKLGKWYFASRNYQFQSPMERINIPGHFLDYSNSLVNW